LPTWFDHVEHRWPKLMMPGVVIVFYLYVNIQRNVTYTGDIYYYITTKFEYAKPDSCLAAYGGVVLQQFEFIKVCLGKDSNERYS